MSDSDDFEPNDENQSRRNPLRDQLDRQAEQIKTLNAEKAEGEKAKKELLFRDAGVDTRTPIGSIFFKGYDGGMTVEEIQATAVEAKLIEANPSNPEHEAERRTLGNIGRAAASSERNAPVVDIAKEASEAKNAEELLEVRKKRKQLAQNS